MLYALNKDIIILFNSRMIFVRKKMYTFPKKCKNNESEDDYYGPVSVTEFNELPWNNNCWKLSLEEVSHTELRIQFFVEQEQNTEKIINIKMHHCPAYEKWIKKIHIQRLWSALERTNLKRLHEIRTAMVMSLHPRLGKNSPLAMLNLDVFHYCCYLLCKV